MANQTLAKPVKSILPAVLTEMRERTTKERLIYTEMRERSPNSVPAFPEFQTLHDPVLEGMLENAILFEIGFTRNLSPRWLSFLGGSGTGKTMLSEFLYKRAKQAQKLTKHQALLSGVRKAFWPKLFSDLRDQRFWLVDEFSEANFLFLDELAAYHDPSGFGQDKLCELLSRRVGKWTLITSNLTLEQLGQIDARISSRMIRGGSLVCDCKTIDFNLRV